MNYSPKDIYSRIALTSNSDITYPSFLTVVLKSTLPSFLIKRAALGNLKVNFHCAHLHSFFPLKKGLSKTHQSSLTVKEGSTSHLGLLPSGKKRKPLLSIVFTTPSVPLVGDRNVALNHFILWLADHQRSTPAAELQFFVRG